jgi:hypothetical protein
VATVATAYSHHSILDIDASLHHADALPHYSYLSCVTDHHHTLVIAFLTRPLRLSMFVHHSRALLRLVLFPCTDKRPALALHLPLNPINARFNGRMDVSGFANL